MSRSSRSVKVEVWMYVRDHAKLRRRRRDKHLTQQQLAALVGCRQQYISKLERTDHDCSPRIAEQISRWLDVDLEDYFEERSVSRMPTVTTDSRVAGNAA